MPDIITDEMLVLKALDKKKWKTTVELIRELGLGRSRNSAFYDHLELMLRSGWVERHVRPISQKQLAWRSGNALYEFRITRKGALYRNELVKKKGPV